MPRSSPAAHADRAAIRDAATAMSAATGERRSRRRSTVPSRAEPLAGTERAGCEDAEPDPRLLPRPRHQNELLYSSPLDAGAVGRRPGPRQSGRDASGDIRRGRAALPSRRFVVRRLAAALLVATRCTSATSRSANISRVVVAQPMSFADLLAPLVTGSLIVIAPIIFLLSIARGVLRSLGGIVSPGRSAHQRGRGDHRRPQPASATADRLRATTSSPV